MVDRDVARLSLSAQPASTSSPVSSGDEELGEQRAAEAETGGAVSVAKRLTGSAMRISSQLREEIVPALPFAVAATREGTHSSSALYDTALCDSAPARTALHSFYDGHQHTAIAVKKVYAEQRDSCVGEGG
jgi:hypothetical protein